MKANTKKEVNGLVFVVLAILLVIALIINLSRYNETNVYFKGVMKGLTGFVTFALQPSSGTISEGAQFRLNITVINVTDLAGVQISITYDSTILSFIRVDEGRFLNSSGTATTLFLPTLNTTQPGLIKDLAIVRFSGGANGSGNVATVFFNAIKAGTSPLTFSNVLLSNSQGSPITTTLSSSSVTVLDVTAPTVSLTAPANGATVQGMVTISATASDNVAVAGVQFKVDGINANPEDTSSPYSISWNSSTVSNGGHTITATARDTSSNTATSASRSITVNNPLPDTTPPGISGGLPVGTLPIGTASTTMSVITNESATCRHSTTPNTAYASMTNTFSSTGGTSHSTLVSGLVDGGTYTYYIRCMDTASNPTTSDYKINFSVAKVLTCSQQGGDICGVSEVCPGINLTASDTTLCCSLACVTPTWSFCSDCGSGLFNVCDRLECYSISEACYFTASGSACNRCSLATCNNYADQQSCIDDHCSFKNCSWSGIQCLALDVNPPNITNIVSSQASGSSVLITFNTNELAVHQIDYGLTTSYGLQTILTSVATTSHSETLTGITQNTTYHFRITVRDPSGNIGTSGDRTFITVLLEGDINSDGSVNILDVQVIVNDFSKTSGFNPKSDVAPPFGEINLFDIMVVIRNWGRTY